MNLEISFPKPDTLAGRALAKLLTGAKVSHKDIYLKCATYRLSASIHLRRHKYSIPVIDEWREELTRDRVGRRARFKRYFIEPDTIRATGERGRKFIQAVRDFETGAGGAAPIAGGGGE